MKYKSLLAYALIALSVYLLQQPEGCKGGAGKAPGQEVVYVPRTDTIIRYVSDGKVIRTVIRRDTVRDRVVFNDFQPTDTAVLILFADRDDSEGVRLFEGVGKGEDGKCDYKYLLGIHEDSLQFLIVETACKQEVKSIIVENPLGFSPVQEPLPNGLMVGAKMGMTLDKTHKSFGVQAAYRGLYAAVDYVPALQKPVLEAGLLLPIRWRQQAKAMPHDTITINYQ